MDKTGLCNLALGSVGARSTISNLQEGSDASLQCLLQYDMALEAVLQAAHWNFARAQISLALLKDGTKSPPDSVPQPWQYEYAYPADCVQARYVMPLFNSPTPSVPGTAALPYFSGNAVPFLVSSDLDTNGARNKVILTNQANAVLVYTTRITDVSLFDGAFLVAFANFLGARVCIPLSGDKNMMKGAYALADSTCRAAQASNGNEGLTVTDTVPDWMRVRGYQSDWGYPGQGAFVCAPINLTMVS